MIKNLSELAKNLGISMVTLDRWIHQGKIPVSRKGDSCEFDFRILKKWADSRKIVFKQGESNITSDVEPKDGKSCFLTDSIKIGGIFYEVEGGSSEAVLNKIALLAPVSGPEAGDALAGSVIERERIRSTGIGKGVAIPHPLKPMTDFFPHSFTTVCFLKHPLDFYSMDGKPVSIVFLIVASSQAEHLKLLSRLSFCLKDKDFMDIVESVPGPDVLISALSSMEIQLSN